MSATPSATTNLNPQPVLDALQEAAKEQGLKMVYDRATRAWQFKKGRDVKVSMTSKELAKRRAGKTPEKFVASVAAKK